MTPRTTQAWDAFQRASAALQQVEAQAEAAIRLARHTYRIAQIEWIEAATEEDRRMKA